MSKTYKEMSIDFQKRFFYYKIKAAFSHWKIVIAGAVLLVIVSSVSAGVRSHITAEHYKQRENPIAIQTAILFAKSGGGVTWKNVMSLISKPCKCQ